ncbi:guanine deaminase [Brachionus plicatilis]|uniref:Guanine deaminase n=1 Tax=Brachionus plicatilis TaxID=10195 RepID=A0A3M7PA28_BRAPC|nr:guanine deaminase [Brachionus plicatilis]
MSYLIFQNANLIHSVDLNNLQILENKTVLVNQDTGIIEKICNHIDEISDQSCINNAKFYQLKSTQFLMPGLVDTHCHAPQFFFTGTGLDLPLLEWLDKYTFPCESKFSDLNFAKKVYEKSVKSHLYCGTTTICFFGTIHLEATKLLVDIIEKSGMRGYVGKVCMDRNSPDWYREETQKSLEDTKNFIDYVLSKQNPILKPVVTPRFAPTCSSQLMLSLAEISESHNIPVQTHLSENVNEVKWVKELFSSESYTAVYDTHGLLNDRTVLAHCIHLEDDELDLIKKRGAGISHCPTSNTSLQSGIMPTRKYLNKGLKIGLGTDVAGGFTPSIIHVIRECIGVSKLYRSFVKSDEEPIGLSEAFYLATIGGAQLLGLEEKIGNFSEGKEFDALLIDFSNIIHKNDDHHEPNFSDDHSLREIFEKFIYLGDDRNIKEIYVKGLRIL